MIFEDFDFCSPSVVDRLVGDAALRTTTVGPTVVIQLGRQLSFMADAMTHSVKTSNKALLWM